MLGLVGDVAEVLVDLGAVGGQFEGRLGFVAKADSFLLAFSLDGRCGGQSGYRTGP